MSRRRETWAVSGLMLKCRGRRLFVDWHPRLSRSLLPTNLPLFSRGPQLSVPLGMDLLLPPCRHVVRRDVADGAVQADVVVMLDVALHQMPRIFQRQRRSRTNALALQQFVPAFD